MSVVPMQKVRLTVHSTDVDKALDIIQKIGALEFRDVDNSGLDTTNPDLISPNSELLPRLQHAVSFLGIYAPKVGLWKTLREGSKYSLSESEVTNYLSDTDAVESVVTDLEALQVEFADKNEQVRSLEEKHSLLSEWKDLPIKLSNIKTKSTVTFLLKNIHTTEKNPLAKSVEEACVEEKVACFITTVSNQSIAVTLSVEEDEKGSIRKIAEKVEAEIVVLPEGEETPDVMFVEVSDKLAVAKSEVALSHDQAEHFALSYLQTLREALEIFQWQHDRYSVVAEAEATKYTIVFEGWLREDMKVSVEESFEKAGVAAMFASKDPEENEEPPVEIKNSKWIQPFEAVTRLYGMPGYKDLDPTVFLSGFFFLFFGLSLTDVGYGLSLMVASSVILLFFKVDKSIRLFAKLLLFIGFSTVLVGMMFGGYLGFDPAFLPEFIQAFQIFDPIGNPLPVFYLALSLGVFQVMVGMALRVYSESRNGRLVGGVLDEGPWLFMFSLGVVYVGVMTGYLDFLTVDQIGNLTLVAVVMIVLANGRKGDNILQRIISSLAGLYAGVGHFSDVLSYSRLLALGLATSALAFAVNLIAGMLLEIPYVGFFLSAVILIAGHLFTLAINTLGAFVHSARLQFVEFFGKFISGTGKQFSPLSRKEKYITIRDD